MRREAGVVDVILDTSGAHRLHSQVSPPYTSMVNIATSIPEHSMTGGREKHATNQSSNSVGNAKFQLTL